MKEDYCISLLYQQFKGEITPSEASELEAWLQASEENRLLAQDMRKAWDLSAGYSMDIPVDLDAEFARLTDRIRVEETPARVVPLRTARFPWVRIAAAVVLLIVVAISIRWMMGGKEALQMAVTGKGEKKELLLSDGSHIWLNEDSRLEFPKSFSGAQREVRLHGEAFFEIAKNPEKPFIIETSTSEVIVVGTSFNVHAYEAESETSVSVQTGKVRFRPKSGSQELVLLPNQKGILTHQNTQLTAVPDQNLNELSWKTGRLSFINTPLSEAIADLQRFYHVEIAMDSRMTDCTYSSPIVNGTAREALTTLANVFHMSLSQTQEGHFLLKGGKCK